MARIFLTTNFKTLDQTQPLAVMESMFQELEDQVNGGTHVLSLTDSSQTIPEGVKSGDVVFSLVRGELKVGVYNGITPVFASFGSFTGGITDAQHGPRAGGDLHAAATTTLAGFMSAADKAKLDAYKGETTAAGPASLTEYPTNGDWGFHLDTVGGTCKLARNVSGTIKSVQLT